MKNTFYDMFRVPHDAKQEQLEAAYEQQTEELNATTNVRGRSETVLATKLLQEGYQILSDPAQRAKYDAKLTAARSGVKLVFFPDGSATHRKGAVEVAVLAVLVTVLGGLIYYQLAREVDQVRMEHAQAVGRQQNEKVRVRTIDTRQSTSAASVAFDDQNSGPAGER